MVSTRLSSIVAGGSDTSGTISEPGPSKSTRHNVAPPPAFQDSISETVTNAEPIQAMNVMNFPPEILLKILGYLPYSSVAHLRLVCRKLDSVCSSILNSTFQRLQSQMLNRFQCIKAKMPRRESARRNHPLACESDIIETLHMRLTLLQMTFGKHIERKHCCFFAGEILDEVYRILHYIKVTPKLARPYKVTDELFDLSTMAMEYFKEHIEPTLPEIAYFGTDFLDFTGAFAPSTSSKSYLSVGSPPEAGALKGDDSPSLLVSIAEDHAVPQPLPQSNMVLRKRIRKIKQGMKRYNSQLTSMRRDLKTCKGKIAEQQKQILEYASRLDEYDKKNEETSRKFSTLLQLRSCKQALCEGGFLILGGARAPLAPLGSTPIMELNKCKTELQYWRSKSPAVPAVCAACGSVATPVPSEDLQALANQGVVPEGLALLDFKSIAGTSHDEPEAGPAKRKPPEEACHGEPKKPRRMHKSRSKRTKLT
ncbi:F-box only protein 28 isoform X1 [Bacillus rossius redtenbacheri]|uniref:F-box only protein 28 isoform X1 n=1 Tax=Bacillus rossius redtenbacheri TaxID=93214 RepID=UPI002FDD2FCE